VSVKGVETYLSINLYTSKPEPSSSTPLGHVAHLLGSSDLDRMSKTGRKLCGPWVQNIIREPPASMAATWYLQKIKRLQRAGAMVESERIERLSP